MEKNEVHKLVLKYVLTLFVVAFLVSAAGAVSRWGGSLAPARTLTVSAEGKTTAAPDLAEISFSVVSQGKDPNALNADNNQKMSAVVAFVKSLGVASSDIATTNYDLEPNYPTVVNQYYPVNVPTIASAPTVVPTPINSNTIIGYTLTQTVEVKVRDFTNIAKLLGGLPPLGINQIGGVTFTFDNPDNVLAIARADALAKARAKAGEMAAEAGVSLGEVVSVQEYGNIPVYPMYAAAPMAAGISNKAALPTIEPGTQDITDQVTVIYSL
jgi:uncharacterized protein YggE